VAQLSCAFAHVGSFAFFRPLFLALRVHRSTLVAHLSKLKKNERFLFITKRVLPIIRSKQEGNE